MGTRINVLMPHYLTDWADRDAAMRVLATTLPVANALTIYWLEATSEPDSVKDWIALPPFPAPETRDYHRYTGPGPLYVDINPHCVHVRAGGRWRGFLSIQPLRSIHILAFKSIANAFDAKTFRCFPDNDFASDAFCDGANFDSCCAILDERFGEAVLLSDAVDSDLVEKTETGCPAMQYVSTRQ